LQLIVEINLHQFSGSNFQHKYLAFRSLAQARLYQLAQILWSWMRVYWQTLRFTIYHLLKLEIWFSLSLSLSRSLALSLSVSCKWKMK